MDALDIGIIIIATAAAVLFKVILFKRIRHWMDQDLIKGLADNDSTKHQFLLKEHQRLLDNKTPRKELHDKLTLAAQNYSAEQ